MEENYETKVVEITSKDLSQFSKFHIKRDLHPKAVEKILSRVKENNRVFGVIVINIRDGERRVIDGNHRFKAIETYLKLNPNEVVKATFDIYKNLSDEEEKEVYLNRNDVETQTKMDFVQTQCYDTFIYQSLIDKKKHFPFVVCLRNSKAASKINHISLQRLIEPYILRNSRSFRSVKTDELLASIRSMDEKDFENLYEFAGMYVDLFGSPEPKTSTTSASFLIAFQRLYWSAINEITKNEFFKRMKENYPKYEKRIKEKASAGSSATTQILVYQQLLDCLNHNIGTRHGNKVKSFLSG